MSATWSKPISARMSAQPEVEPTMEPDAERFRICGITLIAEFPYGSISIKLSTLEVLNLKILIKECENGIVNTEYIR